MRAFLLLRAYDEKIKEAPALILICALIIKDEGFAKESRKERKSRSALCARVSGDQVPA